MRVRFYTVAMKKNILFIAGSIFLLIFSCSSQEKYVKENSDLSFVLEKATSQIDYQIKLINESHTFVNPRTVVDGVIKYVNADDWTSGFFPGTMFYMYELTKDKKWLNYGLKYTEILDSVKYIKWQHDVGFIMNCSFGNALIYTNNEKYKDVIIHAAKSLATRFRPAAGVIQSWDENDGWQGKRGWMCPVIIDNMMNLELLFKATHLSGDSTFYKIAVSHADNTLINHFRNDWSCYHVVDYDKQNGGVRSKQTAQGYSDESSWARGQAWALYGFTMCYRFTRNPQYLEAADNIFKFIFNNVNLPNDLIPYWDFNASNIPNEPRDASSAAIMASALYELAGYGKIEYKQMADKIIDSLRSSAYFAIVGTNGNFLLMHSVGSIPHGHEIDVPLNYADYYFLEALVRKAKIGNK